MPEHLCEGRVMWLGRLGDIARGVGQLLYPNACLVCDAPEAARPGFRHGLCFDCHLAVTADSRGVCPWCAAATGPHADVSNGCAVCRDVPLGFDAGIRLGPYDGRLRDGILRTKSAAGEGLAEMLGRIFAESRADPLRAAGAAVVVPVPLHWRGRWRRGYNQAEAIARELADALGLACEPGWLRRVKRTPQHAQPSATARRENIRGAFRRNPRARFGGRTVLLVDDVMTTGATAGEAARTLKEAGAGRVVAAVLARR